MDTQKNAPIITSNTNGLMSIEKISEIYNAAGSLLKRLWRECAVELRGLDASFDEGIKELRHTVGLLHSPFLHTNDPGGWSRWGHEYSKWHEFHGRGYPSLFFAIKQDPTGTNSLTPRLLFVTRMGFGDRDGEYVGYVNNESAAKFMGAGTGARGRITEGDCLSACQRLAYDQINRYYKEVKRTKEWRTGTAPIQAFHSGIFDIGKNGEDYESIIAASLQSTPNAID